MCTTKALSFNLGQLWPKNLKSSWHSYFKPFKIYTVKLYLLRNKLNKYMVEWYQKTKYQNIKSVLKGCENKHFGCITNPSSPFIQFFFYTDEGSYTRKFCFYNLLWLFWYFVLRYHFTSYLIASVTQVTHLKRTFRSCFKQICAQYFALKTQKK